ncbi:hypothetical protein CK203_097829 [Vitis vinifera]|uniref:Uncharacterized protein n=1 Tax=Vitis vinifera TaxID=29760 RepID=A0A438DFW7_VITVI|nr:hypothetical protein CK203_097829 [Vitis vinifera]
MPLELLSYSKAEAIEIVKFINNDVDALPMTTDNFLGKEGWLNLFLCLCYTSDDDPNAFKSLSESLLREDDVRGGKLLETPGAIYTKPLVGRVWKVLEMPRDVHTSLHYGGRHERSPRLSRRF